MDDVNASDYLAETFGGAVSKSEHTTITLADLLALTSGEAIAGRPVRLMRHAFEDDTAILRNSLKGVDFEAQWPEFTKLDGATKLAALRLNHVVAEMASAEQGSDLFAKEIGNTPVLLAFAATGGYSAEFVGAFDVGPARLTWADFVSRYREHFQDVPKGLHEAFAPVMMSRLGLSKWPRHSNTFYDLAHRRDILPGLSGRLVIRWDSPRAWVQQNCDKEVLEIRRAGYVRDFSDYFDFTLTWDELHAITKAKEGNPDWYHRLSAVSGVYVIRDMNPAGGGRLYVGSAVGSEGIWGRWVGYGSKNWHNGNVALKALYEQDPDYMRNFQFGILQVMSRGTAERDVLDAESSYKNKLGSRVISLGLNRN